MKNLLLVMLLSLSTLNALNDELALFFQDQEHKEPTRAQSPTQEELREKVLVLIKKHNIKYPEQQWPEMPIAFCIQRFGLVNPEFTLLDLEEAFNAKKPRKASRLEEFETMQNFLEYYVSREVSNLLP